MQKTYLKDFNQIGAQIGYPFYVFEDGTYSKKIVNGKMNTVLVVKGPFKADCLVDDDVKQENNLVATISEDEIKAISNAVYDKLSKHDKSAFSTGCALLKCGTFPKDTEQRCLVCRYATAEFLQHYFFAHPDAHLCWWEAFEELMKRTDIPERPIMLDFVKSVKRCCWNKRYTLAVISSEFDEIVRWVICDENFYLEYDETMALAERCLKKRDFQLLDLYRSPFPQAPLLRDVEQLLRQEAKHIPEAQKWLANYLKHLRYPS